jgi:hypothetical protein
VLHQHKFYATARQVVREAREVFPFLLDVETEKFLKDVAKESAEEQAAAKERAAAEAEVAAAVRKPPSTSTAIEVYQGKKLPTKLVVQEFARADMG